MKIYTRYNVQLLGIIIFGVVSTSIYAQDFSCIEGDCQDGYGSCMIGDKKTFTGPYAYEGDVYYGLFKNGKPEGIGEIHSGNGNRFIGNWINGKREGKGIWKSKNGQKQYCTYKNDQKHGCGVLVDKTGKELFHYTWKQGKLIEKNEIIEEVNPEFDIDVMNDDKPVIYLYPEQVQDVTVRLDYNGTLIADYPAYKEAIKGWKVSAYPDGKIINHEYGLEYSYLFWEGTPREKINWNLTKGFVVKGTDTREFLRKTLSRMGLTAVEYNEFIVYWYPRMMNNTYNLIHFADKQYTDHAPLNIEPEPASMLRVFMVYKPKDEVIDIEQQVIEPFQRKGFTVIEWGGTELTGEQ